MAAASMLLLTPGGKGAPVLSSHLDAPQAGVHCTVTRYPLTQANEALADLRDGRLQGAAVLVP